MDHHVNTRQKCWCIPRLLSLPVSVTAHFLDEEGSFWSGSVGDALLHHIGSKLVLRENHNLATDSVDQLCLVLWLSML